MHLPTSAGLKSPESIVSPYASPSAAVPTKGKEPVTFVRAGCVAQNLAVGHSICLSQPNTTGTFTKGPEWRMVLYFFSMEKQMERCDSVILCVMLEFPLIKKIKWSQLSNVVPTPASQPHGRLSEQGSVRSHHYLLSKLFSCHQRYCSQ